MSIFHRMRRLSRIEIVGTVIGNLVKNDVQTHALGNIDVGPASGDKNIILGLCWSDSSFSKTITSFTVGGVALTERVSELGNQADTAIYAGDISSINGSQAISVRFNGACHASSVSGVAITGLRSLVPTMTDSDETGSGAQLVITNLAASVGGIVFAAGVTPNELATVTWGTITKRADVEVDPSGLSVDHRHTVAWDLGERVAANATLDFSSGTQLAVVGAGFR